MKSVLLLGNPYILDSIIPCFRSIKCFDEYDSFIISALSEQIIDKYDNIYVYNDIETAMKFVSDVVIIDDGFYCESRVQELKTFFIKKHKQLKVIKITSAPILQTISNNLMIKTLKSKNTKPTVLVLNVAEPSQIIKALVLLCDTLLDRNIRLLCVSDYNQGLFHKGISHIDICPRSNNTNCLLDFYRKLDYLYTTIDYKNADALVVGVFSEVALLDVDSSYFFEKAIQNLCPDFTICCVPNNSDISKINETLSAKYALDIDSILISNYALHPDYKKQVFRCTNGDFNLAITKKNVSKICDEIIAKLSFKEPVQLK